jgi:DNA-binding NarL/FixJ family response regulator
MQSQAVWIIDPDTDDQDLVKDVWNDLQLPNELQFFTDAKQAMTTLEAEDTAPFIIICELNLPGVSGFEFRKMLLKKKGKRFKSVPFIFWTTQASEMQIVQAYDLSIHGLFIKDSDYNEFKKSFTTIITYWKKSKMPEK